MWANWRMVHTVEFRNLNLERIAILCRQYQKLGKYRDHIVFGPNDVAKLESVFQAVTYDPPVRIGVAFGVEDRFKGTLEIPEVRGEGCWRVRDAKGVGLVCQMGLDHGDILRAVVATYLGNNEIDEFLRWVRKSGWDTENFVFEDEGYRVEIKKSE